MARDFDPYMLSSPRIFMVRMIIFLIIAAFVPLVLYREVATAFMANPGLNGLIVGVLVIGIAMAMRNVVGLIPEVRWVNSFRRRETTLEQTPPRLIAPMATLLRDRADSFALSTSTWRSILDSISTRLDENRDILRYLAGLLVFLGLLGTFWGLVTTVSSVGATIQSLSVGSGDAGIIFEDLKKGLGGAALRHGHRLLVLALRPFRLARARLPRPAGGAGAEPLLHRARRLAVDHHRSGGARPRRRGDRQLARSRSAPRSSGSRASCRRAAAGRAPRPPPWPTSPKASRAWSSTCARSSRWCATGWRRSRTQQQALQETLKRLANATERNVTPLKRVGEGEDDWRAKSLTEIRRET